MWTASNLSCRAWRHTSRRRSTTRSEPRLRNSASRASCLREMPSAPQVVRGAQQSERVGLCARVRKTHTQTKILHSLSVVHIHGVRFTQSQHANPSSLKSLASDQLLPTTRAPSQEQPVVFSVCQTYKTFRLKQLSPILRLAQCFRSRSALTSQLSSHPRSGCVQTSRTCLPVTR